MYLDYILSPGSNVLVIEFGAINLDDQVKTFITGNAAFFGDSTELRYYHDSEFSLLGFNLDTGLPFVVSSGGHGAWGFEVDKGNLATINISGVDALLDGNQMLSMLELEPAGQPGDSVKVKSYVSVGGGDFNSAIAPLHLINPHPLPGMTVELHPFSGTARDVLSGEPIAGAKADRHGGGGGARSRHQHGSRGRHSLAVRD